MHCSIVVLSVYTVEASAGHCVQAPLPCDSLYVPNEHAAHEEEP